MTDFIEKFEQHQLERIRRAIDAYRKRYKVGDTRIAQELWVYLEGKGYSINATEKSVQRLRKGQRIRGIEFLNACVNFLQVSMTLGPHEEAALAMARFISEPYDRDTWTGDEGEYALRIRGEYRGPPKAATSLIGHPVHRQPSKTPQRLVVVSIRAGEENTYGIASETLFLSQESDGSGNTFTRLEGLRLTGICLRIGLGKMLILMRDFGFSHLYTLRAAHHGFSGTMMRPYLGGSCGIEPLLNTPEHYFDVELHRLPSL